MATACVVSQQGRYVREQWLVCAATQLKLATLLSTDVDDHVCVLSEIHKNEAANVGALLFQEVVAILVLFMFFL